MRQLVSRAGSAAVVDAGQDVERSDAGYELVDIASFELPLLDEPVPPSMGHVATMLDQVVSWGKSLKAVRQG